MLVRDAGREPIFNSEISFSGVICRKNSREALRAIHERAIGPARLARQTIHRRGELRPVFARRAISFERSQHRCRGHRLEIGRGAFARPVFRRDDLALLGDPDSALHRTVRLRPDGIERGAATAAHGAAAAVKYLHHRAEPLEHHGERVGGLLQTPYRGQIAAVLVGIRIPDHHFLEAARRGDGRSPPVRSSHSPITCAARSQIADGLEQRHGHDGCVRSCGSRCRGPLPSAEC